MGTFSQILHELILLKKKVTERFKIYRYCNCSENFWPKTNTQQEWLFVFGLGALTGGTPPKVWKQNNKSEELFHSAKGAIMMKALQKCLKNTTLAQWLLNNALFLKAVEHNSLQLCHVVTQMSQNIVSCFLMNLHVTGHHVIKEFILVGWRSDFDGC